MLFTELALQRIEAQTTLLLSRQIGTPNILAKGKLEPRKVWVPSWLAAGNREPNEKEGRGVVEKGKGRALIEVFEPSGDTKEDQPHSRLAPKLKGILKHGKAGTSNGAELKDGTPVSKGPPNIVFSEPQRPTWIWKKEPDERLKIVVDVSNEVSSNLVHRSENLSDFFHETPHEVIINSTLDIEPRRLILYVPGSTKTPPLDLDLNLSKSDAEIVASTPGLVTAAGIHGTSEDDKMKEPDSTLLLKRQQDFNVDAAHAEWRVIQGKLVIWA